MKKENKRFIIFLSFIVVFLIIFSYLYSLNKNTNYLTILMFTPAISVILTRLITKEGFKNLYIKPNFNGNKKWYLSAYFLTPFIAYFGAIIYFVIFKGDFDLLGSKLAIKSNITNTGEYINFLCKMIPLAIILNPIMGILQCLGEEFAWRGYLLPKLTKKYPMQKAVIINGIIWGIWHSPIIVMGFNYGTSNPILGIGAMIIFCVVIGTIESYLFLKTKSIWCPVVFHASINAIDLYKPSTLFMSKTPNLFIGPNLVGIIGGVGFIIVAIILYKKLAKEND